MIRSMTAFGNARTDTPHGTVSIELRSVNSRFLDLHFRIPDDLRQAEMPLRELLSGALARGKVEIRATIVHRRDNDPDALNLEALEQAKDFYARVRAIIPDTAPPRLTELLAWPGVQRNECADVDWTEPTLAAARDALAQLQSARVREGERLAAMIAERADGVRDVVGRVEKQLPQLIVEYRERLARKLRESVETAFPNGFQHISGEELSERLAHEGSLFGLRVDVAEELSRLRSHLAELDGLLAGKGTQRGAGKRLDFLFQEMNREANTLGSKASGMEVTRAAMDLKLLIEQMREQVQNIE